MVHPPYHIFEFTPESLATWCEARGMPAYRAKQVLEWVYQKGVAEPEKMSNLSKLDRERLAKEMVFLSGKTMLHQRATDGTQKLLVEWEDYGRRDGETERRGDGVEAAGAGEAEVAADPSRALPTISLPQVGQVWAQGDPTRQTECVMIPSPGEEPGKGDRFTACVSSQIGCPVGCRFCASGIGGLDASLSAGRIVEQVWRLNQLPEVRRISNVVFMGMGEPLSNLGAVVPAVRTLSALWGMGISARKITISTVGLPKAIEKLAEQLDLPVTLALSLHAPNDAIRRELIPWAEYTTIRELLAACQKWFEKTGREITLEYTLLKGVNDRREHAEELGRLAKTLRANVNLIRYNEVKGMPFARPVDEDVRMFQQVLRGRGVNAHIRASRGRDIAAACGQLRHETGNKAERQMRTQSR